MTAADYIEVGLDTVPGWFNHNDAYAFTLFNALQQRQDVRGDILEIGAYLGRSAILLGFLARPDERVIVCDLFGGNTKHAETMKEQRAWYAELSKERFEENFRRFHDSSPDVIVGTSTEALTALDDTSCRLIHIDGSHAYEIVRHDLDLSRRLLCDDGIVIFDDVFNSQTPGVSAAVWSAVTNAGLQPIASTSKLYATWSATPLVDEFRALLAAQPRLIAFDEHSVAGWPVIELRGAPLSKSIRDVAREVIPPLLLTGARSARHAVRRRRSARRAPRTEDG